MSLVGFWRGLKQKYVGKLAKPNNCDAKCYYNNNPYLFY